MLNRFFITKSVRLSKFIVLGLLVLPVVLLMCLGMGSKGEVEIVRGGIDVVTVVGDWLGNRVLGDGTIIPLAGQVIGLGNGKFRANLLSEFDKRVEPVAVLDGRVEGSAVRFEPNEIKDGVEYRGMIEGGEFSGSFEGKGGGSFVMGKVCRPSAMLGAKPPAGAIVLFDGTGLEEWEPGEVPGFVDISGFLGKHKGGVAYIRSEVYSQRDQEVLLRLGSDDGVKVWVNGELVHANNVLRWIQPDQDEVRVSLKTGWNKLMVKVTSKGMKWGICARFVTDEGEKPYDIWERDIYSEEGNPTRTYLDMNRGYITTWQISGPYMEEGKGVKEVFDVVFAPETDGDGVDWRLIGREYYEKRKIKWKVVDGALEIVGGTGSIKSRKKFTDLKLHMEFRTPFQPERRGQDRGNSGVYLQGRYEVQILDSYGLEGKDDECGGIYKVGAPLVHMCAPPLQWQSYDITFFAPRFNDKGKKVKDARLTALHNGVKIQDNIELPGPTVCALDSDVSEAGGILLQDHGEPVQFRNIWVMDLSKKVKN